MADSVWTSQLRIAGGNAVEDAPQIAFAERRDRRGRLVRLYLMAEAASAGGDAFIDAFVARIGEAFDPARRSLTGALTDAVEGRHEELRQWNREHLPAQQAGYGLSCALLREGEPGILAQVGPALAVLAGDPTPGAYRELHIRAHRGDDPAAGPIGGSGALRVHFFPMPAARDGWALLLTSNAERLLNAPGRAGLGQLAVDDVLPNLYPALRELNQTAALIISLPGNEPPPTPARRVEAPQPPPAEPQPQPPGASQPLQSSVAPPAPQPTPQPDQQTGQQTDRGNAAPEQPSAVHTALTDDEAAPRTRPTEPEAPTEALPPQTEQLDPLEQVEQAEQPEPSAPPAISAPLSVERQMEMVFSAPPEPRAAWPTNPFVAVELSVLAAEAASAGSGARPSWSRPLAELSGDLPDPTARRPELEKRRRHWPPLRTAALAFAAMLLALAAISAALLLPTILSRGDQQFGERLESARQGLAAAALGVDVASSRASLRQALSDVGLALEDKPLDQQALDLRSEIEAALAELDLLVVPAEFETLVDLGRFGPAIALGALRQTADGSALYALDEPGGRVFAISPTGAPSVIFSEGAALDSTGTRRAAKPLSIALDDDALWVLDADGRLFRLNDAGALLIDIPQPARLGSRNAIAIGGGALWLLDAAGGAIWRFPLLNGAGLDAPTRMTPRSDFAAAAEIAVAEQPDGATALFVAMTDGRLRRFIEGEERPLTLQGLDRGPLVPGSLGVGPSGLLYLADRGNDRVLILGPDGALTRQIAAQPLRGLRGVAVDETRGQIIYALPTTLLTSPLPTAD